MSSSSKSPLTYTATIEKLAPQGDGLAKVAPPVFPPLKDDNTPIYVPFTAPGDHIQFRLGPKTKTHYSAYLEKILQPSPYRTTPPCPEFGICGSCHLQHLSDDYIATFKKDLVTQALRRKRINHPTITSIYTAPLGQRRRVRFASIKTINGVILGFHKRSSHTVHPISKCLLLSKELNDIIDPLKEVLKQLSFKKLDIQITLTQTGLDICLFPQDKQNSLNLDDRQLLSTFAQHQPIAQLSFQYNGTIEPLAHLHPARITFGTTTLNLPPASFLQASPQAEQAMSAHIQQITNDASKIADLFCGCGSLSLPLVKQGRHITAIDNNPQAITALRKAAPLGYNTQIANLFTNPVEPAILNQFDVVLFDPPRAGALRQSRNLAQSHVPLVLAMSCNPTTLARDLGVLTTEGAYSIENIFLYDQFLYTPHIEVLVVLRKTGPQIA